MDKKTLKSSKFNSVVIDTLGRLQSYQRLEIDGSHESKDMHFTYTIRRHLDGGFIVSPIRCICRNLLRQKHIGALVYGETPQIAVDTLTNILIKDS